MNLEDKVSLMYFGEKITGVIKNIYQEGDRILLSIQISPYARLWLPPSVILKDA